MKDKTGLVWLKDIPKEHQQKFKEDLGAFKGGPIFKRLQKILAEEEDNLSRSRTSIDLYDSPSWAHKQAFINGQLYALRILKDLIS